MPTSVTVTPEISGQTHQASYGTTSTEHPSVAELFADLGKFYVGGGWAWK